MEQHACLDALSPDCLLGAQLCACVIVPNKVVEQPVPFQEVWEASKEQCHSGCGGRDGVFPWRGSSSAIAVAIESGSGCL